MAMTFRDRLRAGDTLLGPFQSIPEPMVTETVGLAGADFVILDQEHGPITAERAAELCMALESTTAAPIVRVRGNDQPEIQRALDVGAAGVLVPQVEDAAAARAAVAAARYPPAGKRGLSQYVRAGGYVGTAEYTETQNDRVAVVVQVEGEAGVGALDEILAVEGLDGVFIGPYDLSASIDIPGQVGDERVEAMMEEICERAGAAGVTVGTYADDPAMADRWIGAGASMIGLSVVAPVLHDAVRERLAAVGDGAAGADP